MPTFEQALKKHMDAIVKALKSEDVEKALKAFYELGVMLQITHPDKNYEQLQDFIKAHYKEKYNGFHLSDEFIAQANAIGTMATNFYVDHASQDEEKTEQKGDLSIYMTNNALKRAVFCFARLVPKHDDQLKNLDSLVDELAESQSTKVNSWLEKTISTTDLSRKYNLRYLDQLCEKIQQQLLAKIGPMDIEKFSAADRDAFPQVAIAIEQYNKIKELRELLNGSQSTPHERLCGFIKAYNQDETQDSLNKSSLGKNLKEQMSNLFNILRKKGFSDAYSMWKQHKAIQEIDVEIGAIKEPPKLASK